MLICMLVLNSLPLALLCIFLEAAYKPFMEMRWGYTIGKKWRKLKVVDQQSGALMDIEQSLTRFTPWAVAYFAAVFVCIRHYQDPAFADIATMEEYLKFSSEHVLNGNFFISLANNLTIFSIVWMFSDPFNRALHDRFAKTVVINDLEAIERERNIGWED